VAESKTQVTADEEAIKDFVLATVSEKTGYPVEMLDLDLDLEADLGIDTIKQAELFATIRTHYNIPRREDLRLSEYNTLLKVVGFMQTASAETNQAQAAGMSVPAGSEVQSAASVPVDEEALDLAIERKQVEKGGIQRQVPSVVLRPRLDLCQPTGVNLDENSRVLVISDQGEVAKTLARKLRGRKIKVAVLQPDAGLAGSLQELLTEGNFQGVYFLPALDAIPALSSLDYETWQNAFEVRLNVLFTLMKTLPGKPFLVCATRMGGMHGYGVEPARAPEGGAVSGFAKAFAWERPESLVKVVDFSTPSNGASPAFIADCLFKETLADSGVVEVGWKNNLRFGIALVNKPVVDSADNIPDSILTSGNVFLVSGGGAGIIAPIIAELAAATSGTFYLLGRTHLPKPGDPDLDLLKTDRDVLKQKLAQRLVTEGLKVTPVLVERKLAALERASAVLETLSQVEKFGAKAHYICCDVTNASMVNQAMDKIIQSQGRVDVFLHAAGVEHSHKLEDKSFDEFRKVFTVKADGFFHIFKALEARNSLPKATVFFSSVAGRFGNAGQTDYSAVNDLLCKYASAMRRQYPAMKTMAIDWGAWAEVGMASRGYIPSLMERAGIEMMNPVQAASMLRKELTALMDDPEVILAGSLGMLLSPRRADGGLDVERANTALRQGKPIHKMVSRVTRLDLQEGVILEAEIDPKLEPYLRDHSMNGTPVLPGVIGIEGFSVAARHVASVLASDREEFTVSRLEDICFDVPFKFYRNEPRRIIWKARVVSEAEGLVAFATLESIRVRPGQKPEVIQHFSGKAFLEKAASISKDVVAQPPHWNGNATVQSEDIYRLYFHGPSFQVLDGVQRSGDKVLGKLRKDLPPTTSDGRSLSMPLLVELCFQTAGIWEAGTTGILALPHSIESIQLYRHDVNGIAIYAEVTPLESNGEGQRFNARVIDENGSIYLDLQNYSTVALPYSSSPELITPLKVLWD
jgi:NAD(P)-dependent dehydrogenase (short-subunit alcohol dehydrogenase family)